MRQTTGIDVSKDTLDAYRLSDGEHIQVGNDELGHRTLIRWLGKDRGPLVVFEATGAYHRQMETALAARTIPFVKVNPRQARRFAEATGRLAKTDRVDAVMLAKMGAKTDTHIVWFRKSRSGQFRYFQREKTTEFMRK